ncbi:MAG: PIN domain-containing protein [Nanoarchaeota archaeon]
MAIFLDASYILALYNEDDVHHKRAVALSEVINSNEYGQAIISDYIFDEAVSVALRKIGKQEAQLLGKQIIDSLFIVHADKHLFDTALKIFNSSKDPFSFTDCMSQAIMDLAQIRFIATFDKLFEKLNVEVIN